MSMRKEKPLIYILLGTLNGDKFLVEQLESIYNQNYQNWRLLISDDGSTDKTTKIITNYQKIWGQQKLQFIQGPKEGFAKNFLSMACNSNIKADYYAFCDQDDIWLPEKLSIAVENLNKLPTNSVAMYCGRTKYVDSHKNFLGFSARFIHPKTFRNALVQSVGGGNTMVFTNQLKLIIESIGVHDISSHDWWVYQIVTGVGGDVIYDLNPYVEYRQHAHALIGENRSINAKTDRFFALFSGEFKLAIQKNLIILMKYKNLFTKENMQTLELFCKLRNSKLKDRIRLLNICGLYRQTWQGTLSLFIAALFGKI